MYLTRFNPFNEFRGLAAFDEAKTQESFFTPRVNAREDDKAIYLDVELAGVNKDDIKLDIKDEQLIIKGERNFKKEVKEEDFYRIETRFGNFKRIFNLPDHIDSDNVSAHYENGILEVTLPKKPEIDKVKSIKIK